ASHACIKNEQFKSVNMIQYLLNNTAIWLLSLLIFDLFLRREAYHAYNRLYLVGTLLLGIFLPLLRWQDSAVIYGQGLSTTMQNVLRVKETIGSGTAMQHSNINWQVYVTYIYLAGVAGSILLFVVELLKIVTLYNKGSISKEGAWTIIETGKKHSPFSIFNYAFVSNKETYTAEQWKIILTHEQLHSMAFHFVDLLLIQIVRIVFWFNPLVYLYQRRLLLVHEYQADKVSALVPKQYGEFLIEQALLQKAPAIAHSFNYSPLRSRLLMLTKKSTAFAKSKLLLILPLVLACLLLFTENSFSAKFSRDGNIVKYRDNVIELSPPSVPDTVVIMDPTTGQQRTVVARKSPIPIKLNGRKIYKSDDMDVMNTMGGPATNISPFSRDGVKEYLLSNLSSELSKLEDGYYMLNVNNVVINEDGAIVYYEYSGLKGTSNSYPPKPHAEVDSATSDAIGRRVGTLLDNAPKHDPAYYKGNAVPFLVTGVVFLNPFQIKNHKLVSI
ncbi:MAG: M56 family metallopeptidase, partial [Flavipsychrobacter sp.]